MSISLSSEQKAVIQLVRTGLGFPSDYDFSQLTESEWLSALEESRDQALQLTAFNGVAKIKKLLPQCAYKKWVAVATSSLVSNERVLEAQNALTSLLDKHGVNHIIIKGYASAYCYPDYNMRNFGDVDFLVNRAQMDNVEKVLLSDGYVKRIDEHLFHRVYTKGDAHIEMHFEPAGIPEGAAGKILRDFLKDAETRYAVPDFVNFHNPHPDVHAVVILLHSLHHMMGHGMGLRHLCDWGMFVSKTYKDSVWDQKLIPLLKQTGLMKFASILTKTSSLYFGTPLPDWAQGVDEDICREVMNDSFSLGNFGLKNEERAFSGYFISNHGKSGTKNGKLVSLAKTLRDTMFSTYPILRKCILLYPFIFVWRIVKYLFLMALGKKLSLVKLNSYANERKKLYQKFELFDAEK